MNVLFYFSTPINPEIGGTERVTDLMAHYLKSSGYTVYYLIRIDTGKSPKNSDIGTYFLPDPIRINSPTNVSYLEQLLHILRIDILIIQDAGGDDVYLCNHKVLKTNIKIISTIHTSIEAGIKNFDEMWKWEYSWNKPIDSVITFLKRIRFPLLKKYVYKRRLSKMNFMYQYTDRIVVLSPQYIKEYIKSINISCSNKIIAIANPLTYSDMKITSMFEKENSILFVGRFSYQDKRVDRLLHVWHKIQDKLPHWRLDLIGDGIERGNLEDLAQELELKNVFFHGYQYPLAYYSKAKIVSLVSNFEGFSMFLLEGMQNGCVPIAFSSFAAVTDIITDGVNGYLVEPFDLDRYAEKLYKLASDPALLSKMQPLAVQAVEPYNMDRIGHQWIELFRSLENK